MILRLIWLLAASISALLFSSTSFGFRVDNVVVVVVVVTIMSPPMTAYCFHLPLESRTEDKNRANFKLNSCLLFDLSITYK